MNERRNKITRVLLIEGAVNLALCITKLAVGTATQSAVILADALHSLTDLLNNVVAVVALRISHKPADNSHRYGHQKFEYLAIFMLSVLLVVVAIELVLYAIENHGNVVEQSRSGLIILVIAIAVNVVLSRWEAKQAQLLHSHLLAADAKHTLSDVLTSMAVLIGWQLATMGYYWLDTLFCFVVAAVVIRLAWQLFQQALPVLVDADKTREIFSPDQLSNIVKEFSDIHRVTSIRSRAMGEAIIADLTIVVNPLLSVTAAHSLSHAFESRLKETFNLYDVMIHIEPETEEPSRR
ncbi:cation diffusion facilitator family transporter [Alteromonas gilva]|uniref:Cation diffusion facilitator family transporter n=1 Tax=Alteromonas gilva TaxID=2987522 RepID=A0ABT5L2J0_9ALTE|nr:cation diffusion facilitator family transporter [Alteromonas gilva]MDC8831092.1 cation diffusion facilitator family transporter [Alteromonas gilva]